MDELRLEALTLAMRLAARYDARLRDRAYS
jgi:hypothetical protein